jgi:sulfatase modifying factor 1
VVGVSWRQAYDYCLWRSDRVNEGVLMKKGYVARARHPGPAAGKQLYHKIVPFGLYTRPQPGKGATSKKNPLKTAKGTPRTR